jgi:hypothetical protein
MNVNWIAPWNWRWSIRGWFWGIAHDDCSYFVRVCGLEVNIHRI